MMKRVVDQEALDASVQHSDLLEERLTHGWYILDAFVCNELNGFSLVFLFFCFGLRH